MSKTAANTAQNSTGHLDTTSWYRQFWPWFLIALPGAVVVASLITVYIAVTHQDPLVDGNYYKHGLTINERLEAPATPTAAPTPAPSNPGAPH